MNNKKERTGNTFYTLLSFLMKCEISLTAFEEMLFLVTVHPREAQLQQRSTLNVMCKQNQKNNLGTWLENKAGTLKTATI